MDYDSQSDSAEGCVSQEQNDDPEYRERPKRGRRRLPEPDLKKVTDPEVVKTVLRRQRNRANAAASRLRKAEMLTNMKQQVERLEARIRELTYDNLTKQATIDSLTHQLSLLRVRSTAAPTATPSFSGAPGGSSAPASVTPPPPQVAGTAAGRLQAVGGGSSSSETPTPPPTHPSSHRPSMDTSTATASPNPASAPDAPPHHLNAVLPPSAAAPHAVLLRGGMPQVVQQNQHAAGGRGGAARGGRTPPLMPPLAPSPMMEHLKTEEGSQGAAREALAQLATLGAHRPPPLPAFGLQLPQQAQQQGGVASSTGMARAVTYSVTNLASSLGSFPGLGSAAGTAGSGGPGGDMAVDAARWRKGAGGGEEQPAQHVDKGQRAQQTRQDVDVWPQVKVESGGEVGGARNSMELALEGVEGRPQVAMRRHSSLPTTGKRSRRGVSGPTPTAAQNAARTRPPPLPPTSLGGASWHQGLRSIPLPAAGAAHTASQPSFSDSPVVPVLPKGAPPSPAARAQHAQRDPSPFNALAAAPAALAGVRGSHAAGRGSQTTGAYSPTTPKAAAMLPKHAQQVGQLEREVQGSVGRPPLPGPHLSLAALEELYRQTGWQHSTTSVHGQRTKPSPPAADWKVGDTAGAAGAAMPTPQQRMDPQPPPLASPFAAEQPVASAQPAQQRHAADYPHDTAAASGPGAQREPPQQQQAQRPLAGDQIATPAAVPGGEGSPEWLASELSGMDLEELSPFASSALQGLDPPPLQPALSPKRGAVSPKGPLGGPATQEVQPEPGSPFADIRLDDPGDLRELDLGWGSGRIGGLGEDLLGFDQELNRLLTAPAALEHMDLGDLGVL